MKNNLLQIFISTNIFLRKPKNILNCISCPLNIIKIIIEITSSWSFHISVQYVMEITIKQVWKIRTTFPANISSVSSHLSPVGTTRATLDSFVSDLDRMHVSGLWFSLLPFRYRPTHPAWRGESWLPQSIVASHLYGARTWFDWTLQQGHDVGRILMLVICSAVRSF